MLNYTIIEQCMSANKELCLQLIMTVLPDYVLLKLARLSKPCSKAYESHNPSYTSAWRPLRVTHLFAYNTFILNLQLRWCSWLLSGWAPPRPESVAYMPCNSCAAGGL